MITTSTATSRPGWWLPARDHILPVPGVLPLSGAASTGAGHGIAGPLGFLSLAHLEFPPVSGQPEAITAAAHWLLAWAEPGPSWPPYVSSDDLLQAPNPAQLAVAPGRRDAWCYGAPGVAAALHHAGRALGDPSLTRQARKTLDALAARPAETWDTTGPGLCHGTAGVL
ncbi:hypothetical protein PUR61_16990 [Streptomyces sp. BE20]|uniref:lanthionine synthetase LanC family protein n=1 Tax=Streptomyces sp. BE20 TaxID=3002525 RepID=UPI002E79E08B|nr:lanthionine synthetase LanC family protein [Streptomyces sp. BE20]MEE1823874.1 hypothetical protein [Streptomyces sp. BE20]